MNANRQRNAWIWVAVAAITVVTLARTQAGIPQAAALRTAFANPVLQFFSTHSSHESSASSTWTRRSASGHTQRTSQQSPGAWMVFLPIFFIGLVAPLNLISARGMLSLESTLPAPALPSLFQRPPPSFRF